MQIITRISGEDLAEEAMNGNYIGLPYDKLDCQGLVEQILADAGVRKSDGSKYNWRGSNSMFRNFVRWRGTVAECQQKFGKIPQGAFVFIVKNDGKEKDRGYLDGLGNATHVGLFLGGPAVIDSQPTGGVQLRHVKQFTHVCLMNMIDYYTPTEQTQPAQDPRQKALEAVHVLRDAAASDADYLTALETLSSYFNR